MNFNFKSKKFRFFRALGEKGKLFTEYDIIEILSQISVEQIMAYTAPLNGISISFKLMNHTLIALKTHL